LDRAAALLSKAIDAGYKDLAHIEKDSDLDPIRDRADFKNHLKRIEASNFVVSAGIKSKSGDYPGAIRDYDEAIKIDSKSAMAFGNRGWEKHVMKDYVGAPQDYDEAIRLDPKGTNPTVNKAFLLATADDESLRNPELSLSMAEGVLSGDLTDAFAMNAKSYALAAKGDFQKAIEWQNMALANANWPKSVEIDGGVHAKARIEAWEKNEPWHPVSSKN